MPTIDSDAIGGNETLRRRAYELLSTGRKDDTASRVVDYCLIGLILASVLAVVLESMPAIETRYGVFLYWFEVFTVAIFSVEYLLRVWTAVEADGALSGQRGPVAARLRFMSSFHAIVDLLAILPFYLLAFGLLGGPDMRFLRAVRLLRVLKLTRYSAALEMLLLTFSENGRSLSAAFFILLTVMLLAASGIYYFERDAQPVAFGSIPAAMWWAFATLTTVGYGDVTPVTVGGKVFGAIITVVGLGMVALPTGILASGFAQQLRVRADEYKASAEKALDDGILTHQEINNLEKLRVQLGIGRQTADSIVGAGKAKRQLDQPARRCPHCAGELP